LARSGLDPSGLELFTEPGRFIVANAGLLLTRVLYVKERPGQRFIIVDAAMTELLRPALYRAHHHVRKLGTKPTEGNAEPADVVGPVCETGDFLALDRPLPPLERGDLLALESAGAYAATMASTYNARPRAPEVLVDGDSYRVVRRRETVHDLLRDERPQ
jgi:diaminopimelate decarboxylase